MSLQAATSRHSVTVLVQTATTGDSLGVSHVYAPTVPPAVLPCSVTPAKGMERMQLMQRGMDNPHIIGFGADPGIDERNRLRWEGVGNGTILRVMSLPQLVAGLGCYWRVQCDSKTEDNVGLELE